MRALTDLAESTAFGDLLGVLTRCEADGVETAFHNWGHFLPTAWSNEPHRHGFFEVCLAYEGSGSFLVDGTARTIGAGEVFLARPGVVHQIVADQVQGLGIAFWSFTLGSGRPEDGWWSGLAEGPVVAPAEPALVALVCSLAEEAARPRSGTAAVLEALGAALVVSTGRAFSPDVREPLERRHRDRHVAATIHEFLVDNLTSPLTMESVAAAVHLSPRHAERLYRRVHGTSVIAALRELRLAHGARLLLAGPAPVGQVARACGYQDEEAFRAAFRRAHGVPPGAFRRQGGTVHEASGR